MYVDRQSLLVNLYSLLLQRTNYRPLVLRQSHMPIPIAVCDLHLYSQTDTHDLMSSSVAKKLLPNDLYVSFKRLGTCFSVKYPFFSTSNCLKSLLATARRSSTVGVQVIGRFQQLRYLLQSDMISYQVTLPSLFWSIVFTNSFMLSSLKSGFELHFSQASLCILISPVEEMSVQFPYNLKKSLEILRRRSSGRFPKPRFTPLTVLSCNEDELQNPLLAKATSPNVDFCQTLTPDYRNSLAGSIYFRDTKMDVLVSQGVL